MANIPRRIGPWFIVSRIDAGGNSTVYKAHRGDEQMIALKVLNEKDPREEAYKRFRDEVEISLRIGNHPGILPMLDAYLDSPPLWLAMPEATLIRKALGSNPSLESVTTAVAAIANTLAELTDQNIYHRDIKPGNLFQYNGHWVIGDFGLVSFPGKKEITGTTRQIGARNFTAPEMIDDPVNAQGGPADVYSLAKAFYVLATGRQWPPPGLQRVGMTGETIETYIQHPRVRSLDKLIERATANNPTQRLSMNEFTRELKAWLIPLPEHSRPPDLARIVSDLHMATTPVTRAEELRQNRYQLARQVSRKFDAHVKEFLMLLQNQGLNVKSTLNVSSVDERNKNSEISNKLFILSGGPDLRFVGAGGRIQQNAAHYHYDISIGSVNRIPVLRSAVSVPYFNDEYANLLVGHYIHAGPKSEFFWAGRRLFPLGSAQEDHAIAELAAEFIDELQYALQRRSELAQLPDYQPGSTSPNPIESAIPPNLAKRAERARQLMTQHQQIYTVSMGDLLVQKLTQLFSPLGFAPNSFSRSDRIISLGGKSSRTDDAIQISQTGAHIVHPNSDSSNMDLHSGIGIEFYDDGTIYLMAAHIAVRRNPPSQDILWFDSLLIPRNPPNVEEVIDNFAIGLVDSLPSAIARYNELSNSFSGT